MTVSSFYVANNVNDYLQDKLWLNGNLGTIQLHGGAANWTDWRESITWEASLFADHDVDIMWSIPLVPYGANLAAAGAGSYNDKYLALARQIVADTSGSDQIYLRVGWEFNGKNWNSSSAVGQPGNYVAAYHQFADAFRSVSNRFVFEWTPNVGPVDMNPETAYPGDKYVDVVGVDIYYNTRWDSTDAHKAFDYFVGEPFGLQWQQDFAAAHGKPTAIAEWGINSDSPEYVSLMADWVADHDMVYQNYWESNASFQGKLSASQYPHAAAMFQQRFGTAASRGPIHIYNGTAAADTLKGSAGADILTGGMGDDSFTINSSGDHVVEYAAGGRGGTDTAVASVRYTLDDNVENLSLTGTGALNGTGNGQANAISGNSGNNVLKGLDGDDRLFGGAGNDWLEGGNGNDRLDGGVGADTLAGGDGDDLFYVDHVGDLIREYVNHGAGGIDKVYASISYTLPANVENITLLGTGALAATGNTVANLINGNSGNNVIVGGAGQDTVTGGAGADTFRFAAGDAHIYSGAPDRVTDFLHGTDHIGLGFTVAAVLTGAAQSSFSAARTAAQTLFANHAGDHEVASVQVGVDRYLFWSDGGGNTIDSAVMLQGAGSASIGKGDFV